MSDKNLEQLMKTAMVAAGDEDVTGVVINKKNNEPTIQFGKFVVTMAQVYCKITPYVDQKKSYDWNDIIDLVNRANLLALRSKAQPGTNRCTISNGDAISIIESAVWAISRLQSGIALPVVPAVCDENGKDCEVWDCIVRLGYYREGQLYEPLKSYYNEECHICKIGETSIAPYALGGNRA